MQYAQKEKGSKGMEKIQIALNETVIAETNIPVNTKEILRQQLQLLAEVSQENRGNPVALELLTSAICNLVYTLR